MIREIIVVEGKDDITAVKAVVDAEVIATGGYAYGKQLLKTLHTALERRGVIIFTDPDYMGEKIRRDLSRQLPGAKHAFLSQDQAQKKENIGVENARPEDILEALAKAKPLEENVAEEFTMEDMLQCGLTGGAGATKKRDLLGKKLGIGHCNGKQFLKRLNHFSITREEFEKGCEDIDRQ